MTSIVYDDPHGASWPRWWEGSENPDFFGADCVVCGRHVEHPGLHHNTKAIDMDLDSDKGSGFCICSQCVGRWGSRPAYKNIDKHDRAIMQRFSAVYNRLTWEIKNGRRG